MFTWICPQCGREVPPSYTECPDCAERAKAAREAAPPAPPRRRTLLRSIRLKLPASNLSPSAAAQPQYPPPPPPQAQPPQQQQYYAPPPQQRLPASAELLSAAGAASRHEPPGLVDDHPVRPGHRRRGVRNELAAIQSQPGRQRTAPAASVESPAAKPGAKANPLQKYIEISAVRFLQEGKKKTTAARFIVTNHSDSEITGLAGNVTVWGRTQKSEEDAQGTFSFTTNLGPNESKELSAPLNTKLKIYELPDWQNITTDVQITAPAQ